MAEHGDISSTDSESYLSADTDSDFSPDSDSPNESFDIDNIPGAGYLYEPDAPEIAADEDAHRAVAGNISEDWNRSENPMLIHI